MQSKMMKAARAREASMSLRRCHRWAAVPVRPITAALVTEGGNPTRAA